MSGLVHCYAIEALPLKDIGVVDSSAIEELMCDGFEIFTENFRHSRSDFPTGHAQISRTSLLANITIRSCKYLLTFFPIE